MMKMCKWIGLALLTVICFPEKVSAQTAPTEERKEITDQNIGKVSALLRELGEGIQPKSYLREWKKTSADWSSKTSGASSASELSAQLISLSKGIKESSFKPEWEKSKEKWIKQVSNARNSLALSGLIKSLYNYLEADAFAPAFNAGKQQWLDSLNNIQ